MPTGEYADMVMERPAINFGDETLAMAFPSSTLRIQRRDGSVEEKNFATPRAAYYASVHLKHLPSIASAEPAVFNDGPPTAGPTAAGGVPT